MVFTVTSDEDILTIKLRTKQEKSPKVQDVHMRRDMLQFSLKMLRIYGLKSLVVLLRRSIVRYTALF